MTQGMRTAWRRRAAVALLSVCLFAWSLPVLGAPFQQFIAPEPQPGARFGSVLAAFDGGLVVGEPSRVNFEPDFAHLGKAYFFDLVSGEFKFTIDNPEPQDLDSFAGSVTAGGGSLYLSAEGLEERVYAYEASTGSFVKRIDNPEASLSGFGGTLAYGQGGLLVAAPSFGRPGPEPLWNVGQSYLFDGLTGSLEQTFPNYEPNRNDTLGTGNAISLTQDKVVVGSIMDDDTAGRVWIYERHSALPAAIIDNPDRDDKEDFDWFGWAVDSDERVVVVGAQERDVDGIVGAGAAYTFDAATGELIHRLLSPQPATNEEFGRSVSLTSRRDIVIGAWGTTLQGVGGAGSVYLFDGQTGELLRHIRNPQPLDGGVFGWSVDTFGDYLAIGAPGASAGGVPSAGAVYLYRIYPVPEPASIYLIVALIIAFQTGSVVSSRSRTSN